MSQHSKPRSVLVVDDDVIIRNMMADILDFEGYPSRLARNGLEALDVLQGEENYLVFLDVMMPVMDGVQLCAILARETHLRHRHVIVLMSAMDKLAEVPFFQIDATMPKPFTVEDVIKVIELYMH
ncbi:MAG TPA: response regulator [Ktedonobacteraceae bacterium]|nr:response regulator [Ktedonobacteraceae bacterium]